MGDEIGNSIHPPIVRRYPDRFRAYMVANPNYPSVIEYDLEIFADYRDVYVGFKLHPDIHKCEITDQRYAPVFSFANENSLPVLTHSWGYSNLSGADKVRQVAREYPEMKLLLGHSLHGDWDGAVAVACEFENVWLELTAVLLYWCRDFCRHK